MPIDGTFELLAGLHDDNQAAMSFLQKPVYNLDEMDRRESMISLVYSGCFCIKSSKHIDPQQPGMVYIDGEATEAPLIEKPTTMFGQLVGIIVRKYLLEYNKEHEVRYAGAYDTDGIEISEFTFKLKTLPRIEPGVKYPEHDAIVLQAAREGAVLLKNNNTLPLSSGSCVNVFGAAAVVFRLGCLGAGKINPRYGIRVKEGIEKYSSLKLNQELYDFYTEERDVFPPGDMVTRAKDRSGTAVVFITRGSSEAHDVPMDKGGYYLTDQERELIRKITATFGKTVAILNVAHPIETKWIEEYDVDAVLLTGLSGMAGGRALAEILDGTVNPSGKLPNTWAYDYHDYPSAPNFLTKDQIAKKSVGAPIQYATTVYEEGLYVGYRYFDTFQKPAAYLFGHGLSYTTFDTKLKSTAKTDACGTQMDIEVTNTGTRAGKEVVMLYAHFEGGELEQPDKRLVAFAKTKELLPGEAQILCLEVSEKRLKSYSEAEAAWIIEPGRISFLLGGAPNRTTLVWSVDVADKIIVSQVKNRVAPPFPIKELSAKNSNGTYPQGEMTKVYTAEESGGKLPFKNSRAAVGGDGDIPIEHTVERVIRFPELVKDPVLVEQFVAQMTDYELARLSIGGQTGWGIEDNGYAGTLFNEEALDKYEIPDYFFADGNNGLNMFEVNIGFPVSTTVCASFNEELSYAEGAAIAREAKDMNLHCLLAPALNLQRNPLCGRHTEYFSEDPFLAGRMAGQESRGFEESGISSCMKHFFANNAETMRNTNHSIMSERTARELYLAAFETAFEVNKPDTVMTGYNAANGAYCSNDEELLRGILREEFGFTGYVMTDWNGYGDEGMAAPLAAGVSWLAPGSPDDTLVTPIEAALKSGDLSRARVQKNLVDLIKVVLKYREA
ncbi:glycoside hydrolase family 3 C-terminal domain-containing protein [Paenibacillus sp. E222]|uniref:glycoside hydrolase family 3 protein n=1 Tax=Paenibacillus sp. E222 TaxID=2748863 RepID=UPI0015C6262F|nr:glycoside hydrolase family 3 protein [Paenibacillus sp. E222]QLG40499.1 glycoside hydrolase family 3 C-terminal domain-containing protein [Paenibacillus sp. E222]